MAPIIRGEQVYLRPFERSEAELYRRWRADARPMELAGFPDPAPASLAEAQKRIEEAVAPERTGEYLFAICLIDGERPIGEASLFRLDFINGNAELGIFIGEPDKWGRGYGTDAVNALVDFGFGQLRLERIGLEVSTTNGRARRAYEKAGFVHEGTVRHDRHERGEYTDGHVMSILRDEWLALPRRSHA